MAEEKYFTPDIEDIHLGFECEFQDNYGFESFNNGEENWISRKIKLKEENGAYTSEIEDILIGMDDGYQPVRVAYLTKEQIEAEGWVLGGYQCNEDKIYEKNLYMLNYNEKTKQAILLIRDPALVPDYYLEPSFRGECKDINTFRLICKLLKI